MSKLRLLALFCVMDFVFVGQSVAVEMKTSIPLAYYNFSPGYRYDYSKNIKIFTSEEVDRNLDLLDRLARGKIITGFKVANNFLLDVLTLRYLYGFDKYNILDIAYFSKLKGEPISEDDYRKKYIIPYITSEFNNKLIKYGEENIDRMAREFIERPVVCPYVILSNYSVDDNTMKVSYSFQAIRQIESRPEGSFYHKIDKEMPVNFDLAYMQDRWVVSDFKELGKFHLKAFFIDKDNPKKGSATFKWIKNFEPMFEGPFHAAVEAMRECRKLS